MGKKIENNCLSGAGYTLPKEGFVRVKQLCNSKGNQGILGISKSNFWQGIRDGRFPKPIKLGKRTSVWRVSDIRSLIEQGVKGAAL